MHPSDLDNAYAYEIERRKDEIRNAANHRMVHHLPEGRKRIALPIAFLSIIIWVVATLMSQ